MFDEKQAAIHLVLMFYFPTYGSRGQQPPVSFWLVGKINTHQLTPNLQIVNSSQVIFQTLVPQLMVMIVEMSVRTYQRGSGHTNVGEGRLARHACAITAGFGV